MKMVNKATPKRDGMKLVTGAPVYTDDLAPKDALIVKLLRSPHHFAKIKKIDTSIAYKVPGVVCILTYKDIPSKVLTRAGQTFPEPSPQDWKVLDQILRYIGDEVAIIAAETEAAASKAMSLIKVDYEILEPVLDYTTATEQKSIVHPEPEAFTHFEFGFKPEKNIASGYAVSVGDYKKGFEESDVVLTRQYTTHATHPGMMEPLTTYTYMDHFNRLVVVSATQIPFHIRRMVANALEMTISNVRVIKPRIGGGFGCKQTAGSEFFPALVTQKTGRPAKIFYTRDEVFRASTRRHPFTIDVTVGATKEGILKAFDIKALSDTGAYGEHAGTVMEACAEKIVAFYNKLIGYKFEGTAVYTNNIPSGAFRGYGKTQGGFAIESILNELAVELNMDPTILREKNIIHKGENLLLGTNHVYEDDIIRQDSCELEYCLQKGRELSQWSQKYQKSNKGTKVKGIGMALSTQGSGVLNIDSGGATVKLNCDGVFTLLISATDMGTGCDTILSQMAAEVLQVPLESIIVYSADTDVTPYDDGSYASSSTYVTGTAVKQASEEILRLMIEEVALILKSPLETIKYDSGVFYAVDQIMTLQELGFKLNRKQLTVTRSHVCSKEAPPYKAGYAEVEVDLETGKVDVLNFTGVIDCGTVINTNLALVQAQGGILQGIGMTLFEEINYSNSGHEMNTNFLTYKIPSRKDNTTINVDFADSYEPTGPFGAKSIGEIVINTAAPAIADAIYNATGVRMRNLPFTPEKVFMALHQKKQS